MQGKVSMVVPCYNKEQYIDAMLLSVENQAWDNIELILVNDGSTDKTREIIENWRPRLTHRGYKVIVIDQINGGCCAAVKTGLEQMTGDYFCLVDCDDEVHPEYVSMMAGWLDEHDDYDWAACTYRPYMHSDIGITAGDIAKWPYPQDADKLLEKYIFRKVITMAWIYMARSSYVRRCGMIDNFCSERKATYEPLIVVPLAAGGGKLKYFHEPLYKYNMFASDLYRFDRFEKAIKYYDDYLYLYKWAISRLQKPEKEKTHLYSIARLMYEKELFMQIPRVQDGEAYFDSISISLVKLLDELFYPAPRIPYERIRETSFWNTFEAIEDSICAGKASAFHEELAGKRIIGYGVLGKVAQSWIPRLKGTRLEPVILWDAAGDGVSAERPDFSDLTESDAIIVFPRAQEIRDDVLKNSNGAKVITIEDVSSCSYIYQYPELFEGTRFAP